MNFSPRIKFLISHGLKGFLWLLILIVAYILFEELVMNKNPEIWIERFYSRPGIIYAIYIGSESFIGLFPPELFMLWALDKGGTFQYVVHVVLFGAVSFFLGYVNYLIVRLFLKKGILKNLRSKRFGETLSQLKKYGLFLIIVAAMTPVPWAATCLLVGWADYPQNKFLLYASSRLIRFGIYGFIVYQTNHF